MPDVPAVVPPEVGARLRAKLGADNASAYPTHLEKFFPHVFAEIERRWGGPEMMSYFDDLLITRRPGRQGFPAEAAREILALLSVHRKQGWVVDKPRGDIWDWVIDIDKPGSSGRE